MKAVNGLNRTVSERRKSKVGGKPKGRSRMAIRSKAPLLGRTVASTAMYTTLTLVRWSHGAPLRRQVPVRVCVETRTNPWNARGGCTTEHRTPTPCSC